MIENYQQQVDKIKKFRQKLFAFYTSYSRETKDILSFISLENGAQPPKEMHIYNYKKGYVRFIQNRDYSSSSHLTFIPISKNNHICNKKDIMMDKYGEAGAIRYGLDGAYNVALVKIIPTFNYMKEYIRDFLSQSSIKNILFSSSQASTRASLNESTFKALKFPVLTEEKFNEYQKKLEYILDYELSVLDKIEKLKEIKSKLLEKYF